MKIFYLCIVVVLIGCRRDELEEYERAKYCVDQYNGIVKQDSVIRKYENYLASAQGERRTAIINQIKIEKEVIKSLISVYHQKCNDDNLGIIKKY